MATQSMQSLINSVRSSVQSPLTCTSDTISLLRNLLAAAQDERKPTGRKPTKTVKTAPTTRKTRPLSSRTAKVAVFQPDPELAVPIVSKSTKIALATDIFNTSSKALSEFIKQRSSKPVIKFRKSDASTRAPLSPKKPLQPTSPNRTIRSPAKTKEKLETSERLERKNTPDIRPIAEASLLALSSLRELKCGEGDMQELDFNLEQGLCILVGKLFALSFTDMAIAELQLLKSRIWTYFSGGNAKAKTKRTGNASKTQQSEKTSERLEDLVMIPKAPESGPMAQLLVTFQSLALRAVAMKSEPGTIQKIEGHLVLSNPCSPTSVILAAYKAGFLSESKAAQQLQSLSSSILSLSLIGGSAPGVLSTSRNRNKPTVALGLQILSLEIQCLWWRIAAHKYDMEKEIWGPLARYLSAFARSCPTVKKPEFDYIKETFMRLKSILTSNGHDVNVRNAKSASASLVLRLMSQLAFSAGCLSDAAEFCKASAACLSSSQPLQLAISHCKIAHIAIESAKISKPGALNSISTAIAEAAKRLSSPLKGNLSDLDELLMESAKLKKVIMKATNDLVNGSAINAEDTGVDNLWLNVIEYLVSFVRFLSRYLGPTLDLDADIDSRNLFSERVSACRNIAFAAVDSSVAVGKISLSTNQIPWRLIEPLLADCFSLLTRLDCDPSSENQGSSGSASSSFLRLSNLFWSCYATQKEAGRSPFELIPLLERSIQILGSCTPADQDSGFLAIKLERIAIIYSDVGHEAKAELNYFSAIRAHIRSGTLDLASKLAAGQPVGRIWKSPQSPVFAFGRVLSSYIRARLKQIRKCAQLVYDDEALDAGHRGTLLERQLAIVVDVCAAHPPGTLSQAISSVTTQLLSVYTVENFPLRRSRVILSVLRLLMESNVEFDSNFCESVVTEAKLCLSYQSGLCEDMGLSTYKEDLCTSLRLALGFHCDTLTSKELQTVIQSWSHMAKDWTTWELVETRIFDPQVWISQIRALTDYLEIQGQWTMQITILSVLNKVLELQKRQDASMLVTSLSILGLQLSRLGMCDGARNALTNAKELIKLHDVCPSVSISWHLAYAEYLVETGDWQQR